MCGAGGKLASSFKTQASVARYDEVIVSAAGDLIARSAR
jgi:hypothetical protein